MNKTCDCTNFSAAWSCTVHKVYQCTHCSELELNSFRASFELHRTNTHICIQGKMWTKMMKLRAYYSSFEMHIWFHCSWRQQHTPAWENEQPTRERERKQQKQNKCSAWKKKNCVCVCEIEKHKCLMCTDMIQNRLEHTANKNHDEWTRQRERRWTRGVWGRAREMPSTFSSGAEVKALSK